MPIVTLKLPNVKQKTEARPKVCPYCKGGTFQRWGQVLKPVKDSRVRNVKVYRYRCCHCQRTFRHYPEGNTRADQTQRLQIFAAILWRLGLSHRASSLILSALKVSLSHMSVWRDVQAQAERRKRGGQWQPVRVLGLDGAYVLGWGSKQPVLVAVDLGTGEPLAIGYVNEYDPQAVRRWLEPLVQQHGITVIVTDDLFSYKLVAEQLQLGHQICQPVLVLFQGSMCAAGWAGASKSWMRSANYLKLCHLLAANACMPSGNNCLVGARHPTRLVPPWNNYAICSCG
jgi:hypothetical protein